MSSHYVAERILTVFIIANESDSCMRFRLICFDWLELERLDIKGVGVSANFKTFLEGAC